MFPAKFVFFLLLRRGDTQKFYDCPQILIFIRSRLGLNQINCYEMLTTEEIYKLFVDEEYGVSIHLSRAEVSNGDLLLYISINRDIAFSNPESDENWKIEAKTYKDCKISFGSTTAYIMEEDDPLLWKYTDVQCELYYSGKCTEPANLIADLYSLELDLFKNYQHFGEHLNGGDIFRLLNADSGLFARGPQKLLSIYADHFTKYNINASIIASNSPVKETVTSRGHFKLLLLGDHGYVIAEKFNFMRQ